VRILAAAFLAGILSVKGKFSHFSKYHSSRASSSSEKGSLTVILYSAPDEPNCSVVAKISSFFLHFADDYRRGHRHISEFGLSEYSMNWGLLPIVVAGDQNTPWQ